jgi:hypothetical protein
MEFLSDHWYVLDTSTDVLGVSDLVAAVLAAASRCSGAAVQ